MRSFQEKLENFLGFVALIMALVAGLLGILICAVFIGRLAVGLAQ